MYRNGKILIGLGLGIVAGLLVVTLRGGGLIGLSFRPPRVVVPDSDLLLPASAPHQVVMTSFRVGNRGGGTLRFHIEASCGCVNLNPRTGVVGSDDWQIVRLGLRIDKRGEQKNVQVTVNSNDQNRPSASFLVRGHCPALVSVEPEQIDLGKIFEGRPARGHALLKRVSEQPGISLRSLKLSLDNPYFAIISDEADDGEREISVELSAHAPAGYYAAILELAPVEGQDEPIRVPVSAEVVRSVTVSPAVVFLRREKRPEEFTFLVVARDDLKLGAIEEKQLPEGVSLEELSQVGDRIRRFRGRIETVLSDETGIRMKFEGAEETVLLRLVTLTGE